MAPGYGSISSKDEEVELLPPHHPHAANYENGDSINGTINANGSEVSSTKKSWITRHHCISYTLAALICLGSTHYWHTRADSYDIGAGGNDDLVDDDDNHRSSRVPMPPALSTLNPHSDLGFRSTTREGLATPSKAWGERYLNATAGEEGFTPLPTNEWYLNLLSHRAAADPLTTNEVGHVYTLPYIVGISPPHCPALPSETQSTTLAGIELSLPVMKTSDINIQMIYDKSNALSLGAIVNEEGVKSAEDGGSSLASYEVDPDEPLSPLGVSLKWNNVNMKSSIVRGMPYGTMRFGKDDRTHQSVLPTFASGNRPVTILLDSKETTFKTLKTGRKNALKTGDRKMMCGTLNGKPEQLPGGQTAPISADGKAHAYSVEKEMIFHMHQSDFTWVAFFSKPVKVQCFSDILPLVSVPGAITKVQFRVNVVEVDNGKNPEEELVVRVALLDECTTGQSQMHAHCDHLKTLGYETTFGENKVKEYLKVLREGAMLYPKSPLVGTEFPKEDDETDKGGEVSKDRVTNVVFDWDATPVKAGGAPPAVATPSLRATVEPPKATITDMSLGVEALKNQKDDAFIMFALPHHLETFASATREDGSNQFTYDDDSLCLHSFHGRTCLVHGSVWNLPVEHGTPQSFLADRPPSAKAIPSIAEALGEDVQFQINPNVLRGAVDTYFSGKIVAKMGRIIEINEELQNLQSGGKELSYADADDVVVKESASAAAEVTIPSEEEGEPLLDDLQQAVEVFLNSGGKENGGSEAEFIYDATWGGFINCGCKYTFDPKDEHNGTCSNTFPDCPALDSVNENFGNGWYNDHHFHYGYHIYAAAIVAKHRPEWGRKYYERILLYIRDIANPSAKDDYFPMFRQKDWYLGNSWAAGLMSMEVSPHGREQESSSEAIAAFEGIALFGDVMMDVFAEDEDKLESSRLVRNIGEFLTAMEVSAANRFWHVWGSKSDEEGSTSVSSSNNGATKHKAHINTYPKDYTKHVVGMMYDTMASFQTWFGPQDVLSYGIQLIPLTSVAERRDDPEWANILYPFYAESCKKANEGSNGLCEDNGWSILQAGLLAETGEIEEALELASDVPDDVYLTDGGCGNSLSNTLWFISTRRQSPSMSER